MEDIISGERLGCVHGEDVIYVFGVPLFFHSTPSTSGSGGSSLGGDHTDLGLRSGEDDGTPKLGFFSGNFTRNEVQLSQTVMLLWANFIRTGNPNEGYADTDGGSGAQSSSSSSNRLVGDKSKTKMVEWPPYDPLYKKYLAIDMKPRVRTHYRAHKLSFWLHLVPDLMKNGYGASGNHHALSNPPGFGNSNAGQAVLSSLDSSAQNTSTPSPPTIQLVGPPLWEHNPNH
ncbi:unnamed protein product, partial [Allacma fusca]